MRFMLLQITTTTVAIRPDDRIAVVRILKSVPQVLTSDSEPASSDKPIDFSRQAALTRG